MKRLVVGTRASKLALAQTRVVAGLINRRFPGLEIEVVSVTTLGDRLPPEKRAGVDEKTAFTGDLESKLIAAEVDVAVHSMKDLPSEMDERLIIAGTPRRADPRDVLLSTSGRPISGLPHGARVGTSSLRRRAQLLRMREDIEVVEQHGNVETRIRKMGEGLDAIVLAAAGLVRLGASDRIVQYFTVDEMVPAVGQGILAVQARRKDDEITQMLSEIDDRNARVEATCERAFALRLGGDCYVPAGAHAVASEKSLSVVGMIAAPDGKELIRETLRGEPAQAEALGARLADELRRRGGEEILAGAKS